MRNLLAIAFSERMDGPPFTLLLGQFASAAVPAFACCESHHTRLALP
jgi:hypothetical protein